MRFQLKDFLAFKFVVKSFDPGGSFGSKTTGVITISEIDSRKVFEEADAVKKREKFEKQKNNLKVNSPRQSDRPVSGRELVRRIAPRYRNSNLIARMPRRK